MSLQLELDDSQEAVAETLAKFCAERCDAETLKATAGAFPSALWRALADLGVLALVTPEGDGGALELGLTQICHLLDHGKAEIKLSDECG